VDTFDVRIKIPVAILLGTLWVHLIMLPVFLAGELAAPPVSLWIILSAIFLYSIYTGVRAWRRGWKSRFIFRIVVPVTLLTISFVLQWTGTWTRLVT
jgi:hypothetical protein